MEAKSEVQGPPEAHVEWHEGHYNAVRKAMEAVQKMDIEER